MANKTAALVELNNAAALLSRAMRQDHGWIMLCAARWYAAKAAYDIACAAVSA